MNQYCWFFGCPRVQESHSHVFLCVPDQIPYLRFSWICWKVDMQGGAIGYILGRFGNIVQIDSLFCLWESGPLVQTRMKGLNKAASHPVWKYKTATHCGCFVLCPSCTCCLFCFTLYSFFFLFWLLCSCCSHDIVWRLTQPSSSSFSE